MARKKMDISADGLFTVELADAPLSPWLRLAHVTRYPSRAELHVRLRALRDYEIVLQLEGSAWIYLGELNGSVDIRAGQVAFIPPGFRHGWGSAPGSHIAVHFDLHAQPKLNHPAQLRYLNDLVVRTPLERMPRFSLTMNSGGEAVLLPLVTTVRDGALWRRQLQALVELWQRRAHLGVPARMLTAETLTWALRTLAEDAHQTGTRGETESADPRILQLLRELELSPEKRPSVEELAARARMGLTAFREAFIKATGRGPRLYIEERRVERAARALLETDLPVYEIAGNEGYDDPYHFSRIFKRVTGKSPRQYRRSVRE